MTGNSLREAQKAIDAMNDARLVSVLTAMRERFPLDDSERIYGLDMHEWYDLLYAETDRRNLNV